MTVETKQVIDFLFASLENKETTIAQQQQRIAELERELKGKQANVAQMAAAANS